VQKTSDHPDQRHQVRQRDCIGKIDDGALVIADHGPRPSAHVVSNGIIGIDGIGLVVELQSFTSIVLVLCGIEFLVGQQQDQLWICGVLGHAFDQRGLGFFDVAVFGPNLVCSIPIHLAGPQPGSSVSIVDQRSQPQMPLITIVDGGGAQLRTVRAKLKPFERLWIAGKLQEAVQAPIEDPDLGNIPRKQAAA
jgi:hypothetical protein